ncbi:HAD hydrolase family protein [Alteromonas sp. CyTr2]|uniref:HAD hydrolase family protein n=1 Tax=Alteromonas sp. CyTr2 TaxID=2935039 RepID=UPI00248DA134|nr:HAD hydrolase family protein [Alteromonas sp. CyTr2]
MSKRLILDIDDTISFTASGDYKNASLNQEIVNVIKRYKSLGFEIVFSTARNMRTYKGNVGKINANTLPIIIDWLEENGIPYDEVYTGKPWCGFEGFYVDDKAIRPKEFITNSYEEIMELLEKDKLEPTT